MRVGVVCIQHESNTFVGEQTQWRHFQEDLLLVGEALVEPMARTRHEIGGALQGLQEERVAVVPLLVARAIPHGPLQAGVLERLIKLLDEQLERAGRLDAIVAAPHGAMVATGRPDADGWWLQVLRQRAGEDVPIVATADLHANLSQAAAAAVDALIPYRTNPHLDQWERGRQAATLAVAAARKDVQPAMAAVFLPMAVSIERQLTDEPHWQPVLQVAEQLRGTEGILEAGIVYGFPYADVPQMGTSVVATSDGDVAAAARAARALADVIWQNRHQFAGAGMSIQQAIQQAASLPGPVGLLDMGDNVGGGSPGDGTLLVHALRDAGLLPAAACLFDPEAAGQAARAGSGARVHATVGGRHDPEMGKPVEGDFEVIVAGNGKFFEASPSHGAWTWYDQGLTAVLRSSDGLTLLVNSRRTPPFSLKQLTQFGIDPLAQKAIVIKGVHAPVAAYRQVCPHLLRVNTPGPTCADLLRLPWHHRRKPMFPWEPEEAVWSGEVWTRESPRRQT